MKAKCRRSKVAFSIALLLAGQNSLCAQEANTNSENESEGLNYEEIIVTGTSVERSKFDTPLTVSSIPEEDLRLFSGSGSQADILQQIPGLKAEGGGGEVATNLRVRGLPSGGQFEFTPLNYDGVTVFSSFGLNSSSFDFFARNDLGIQNVEFVKGGVSNLFGVSSTAGIINYISKTGTEEDHGTLQLELAEDSRIRGDFAFQGPVSDNTFYAVSGFYRYDEGPIETGQPTEGFGLRGNVERRFEDGSGFFRLHAAYVNDRVNFYLPLPLQASNRERAAGNNNETVFSTNFSRINGVRVPSPEGQTQFDSDNGFRTVGGSVYAIFEKELDNGWGFDGKIKYSSYDSGSNFFNNGVGPQTPLSQADTLTNLGLTGVARFTDVSTGASLGPTDLVFQNGFNDRERDATDGTIEFNVTKELEVGGLQHNLTFGTFFARAEAENIQRSIRVLTQFNNDPTLVDLTIDGFQYTVGGITQAPSAYANQTRSSLRQAIYFADQIQGDRWSFDAGIRVERNEIENRFELTETVQSTLATNPLPGAPINTLAFGTGQFREGDASTTGVAVAVGGLYRLSDSLNFFANASSGYFFPQAQGTGGQINTVGDIVVFDAEDITQVETGLKFRTDNLDAYASVFYTGLRDRNSVTFVGDNLVAQVTPTDTDTYGIELDAAYQLNDFLQLNANFTYQDSEFVGGSPAGILGRELNRLPDMLVNVGGKFNYNQFDAALYLNYQGDTFQDASNNVPLDSYSIVRAEAGYTADFGDSKMRFSLGVWNVFDDQGLAEGNPRAGLQQSATAGDFFNGRPILPRRITARITYDF